MFKTVDFVNNGDMEKKERGDFSIDVVLVNYNTTQETVACVRSIMDSERTQVDLRIFIVDNSDRTPLPKLDGVVVLKPDRNIGLSPAWYMVFQEIRKNPSDYVMFLNNDVKVAKNIFIELDIGISRWGSNCAFGGRIYRLDQPNLVWSRGGSINARKVVIRHDDCDVHKSTIQDGDFETGHISGCCMIIPVGLLEKIGGPDPDFFFRGEEWDLNFRLLSAGVKLVILDRMELWHAVNASHNRFSPDMLYLAYRAKVLFARKHHSYWWFPIWYVMGIVFAALISPNRFANESNQAIWPIRKALMKAFIDGLFFKAIRPSSKLGNN